MKYQSKGMENNWFRENFNDYVALYNLARAGCRWPRPGAAEKSPRLMFSEVVFGFFSLLGFRFNPRLADLPD